MPEYRIFKEFFIDAGNEDEAMEILIMERGLKEVLGKFEGEVIYWDIELEDDPDLVMSR